MTANQQKELGKYFIDLSKIAAGVYAFTSLPNKPFLFILGLLIAVLLLGAGLILLKGE
jgi:hypothetical protein